MWHVSDGIRQLGKGRMFLLGVLTGGHTAIHWFQQLFPVILPEIKADLQLMDVKVLLRRPNVIVLILASGLMGMGRLSTLTFLPIYLREQLGYSPFLLGFHVMLLYMMGMVSQPLMGILSDTFGRRAVLVPGMACLGLLYFALAWASSGVQLGLVIAAMGLFFYGLGNITMAGVMDVAGAGVQATSWGLMLETGYALRGLCQRKWIRVSHPDNG